VLLRVLGDARDPIFVISFLLQLVDQTQKTVLDFIMEQIEIAEALATEARHFIACVEQQETSLTDGHAGLRVVRILEAATQSIAARGRVVELDTVRCAV